MLLYLLSQVNPQIDEGIKECELDYYLSKTNYLNKDWSI